MRIAHLKWELSQPAHLRLHQHFDVLKMYIGFAEGGDSGVEPTARVNAHDTSSHHSRMMSGHCFMGKYLYQTRRFLED